jgi:thymidylate synthase ThyX
MTHRVFSRNAGSSRAIPIESLIKDIVDDPVEPIFMNNKKGMSAVEETTGWKLATAKLSWDTARNRAVSHAVELSKIGVHKQIANRLLEPFSHINVLVTATEWDNFFNLRISPEAQQEICELAKSMKQVMYDSIPIEDVVHLPYIDDEDKKHFNNILFDLQKISVARCARVSYLNFENKKDYKDDLRLFDQLYTSKHMSPFEHTAFAMFEPEGLSRNFKGWVQFRESMEKV